MALHPSLIFSVTPLALSDRIGLPYSPALLLDAGFDASITDGVDFSRACKAGFEDFLEEMYEEDENGKVFLGCLYMWHGVQRMIAENVTRRYDALEKHYGRSPLSWRAGFMLGWLSALAVVDRALALQGVEFLAVLVPSCQREEARRVPSCVVGGDGWPLDR